MKNFVKILFILSIFLNVTSYSQVSLQWERTYNGPANNEDTPHDILLDNSKNVYTVGVSRNSVQYHDVDIAIVKYDSNGTQKWVTRFPNSVTSKSVIDPAGNIYSAGFKYIGTTSQAPLIVKFDANGNVAWTIQLVQSPYYREFTDIKIDNNGNIFAAGSENDTLLVLKLNSAGNILWTGHYKNPDYTYGSIPNALIFDNSGNIIVCGYTIVGTNNGEDALLLKFNSSGILQWSSITGQPGIIDEWMDVAVDQASNIIVTGNTQNQQLYSEAITAKYSTSGSLTWSVISPPSSRANEIKLDNLNNIYISGYWELNSTQNGSGIMKLNNNGIQQWIRIQQIPNGEESPGSLIIDNFSNIYLSKTFYGYVGGNAYSKIEKYNSNGDSLWTVFKIGNPHAAQTSSDLAAISIDDLNNVYLATTGGGELYLNDYYTLKYSQTNYTVSGTVTYKDNNQPVSLGFVKALYYDKSTASIITVDSCAINSNGTYTLTRIPKDSVDIMYYQNDDALDFVPTYYQSTTDWKLASKIYAAQNLTNINGQVYRITNTNNPYTISGQCTQNTGMDVTGNLKDAIIYAKIGNDFKNYGISLSDGSYIADKLPPGNYTLTAYRMGFDPVTQNVTITNSNVPNINFNFGSPIGIQPLSSKIPSHFKLYQNYPNPFNPETNIKFDIPKTQNVKIIVYDIMGREVSALVNEELKAGEYNVKWNANNFASGVYFYRLITGSFSETRKLLLIK